MSHTPPCLGLTGGIGAGKSAALAAFAAHGAATLSSDEVVHGLYARSDLIAAVADRFGRDVVRPDGSVDRALVGQRAFGDAAALGFLEGLLHPRIAAARAEWVADQRARDAPAPVLVIEVPLLFEAGLEDQFDAVVVVTAPDQVRRGRVAARGQDFAARAGRQWPQADKVARADHHYVNDGTLEELDAFAASVVRHYAGSP